MKLAALTASLFLLAAGAGSAPRESPSFSAAPVWVTGYIASWTIHMGSGTNGNYGNMPFDSVDLSAVTHVIMFAAAVNWDGTLSYNNMVSSRRRPFNDYAHAKGKPVIMSIGGAGNTAFADAIGSASRTALVATLMNAVRTERYDGIDVDLEPVTSGDTANLRMFILQLRDSLETIAAFYDPSKDQLLTAAVYNQESFWKRMSGVMDQINVMTYDLFGTWFGKSWHNNAPYGGSSDVDVNGAPMTTVQNKIQRYIDAGIPPSKLGAGIDFNGYIWKGGLRNDGSGNGITAPRQTWSSAPSLLSWNETYGWKIKRDWVDPNPGSVHFDAVSKVPYIGIDDTGNTNDTYVTYQDTATVREIIGLASAAGIGGVFVWEIGGGYLGPAEFPASQYPGLVRDPMLRALKQTTGPPPSPPSPPQLVFPGNNAAGISLGPKLIWRKVQGNIAYRLQASASSSFSTKIVDRSDLTDTTFSLSALPQETKFYWRVRSTTASGTSSWSIAWNFTTLVLPRITGVVYYDVDADGSKDAGEPVLPGWTVRLSGRLTDNAKTDSGGRYLFANLPNGTYAVEEALVPSWSRTAPGGPGTFTFDVDSLHPVSTGNFGNHAPFARGASYVKFWNTVSLPVSVPDAGATTVFPSAVSYLFSFQGSYEPRTTLAGGAGYWVKFGSPQTLWFGGAQVASDTVDLLEGWNLVGSVSDGVPVSALRTVPPGIITSNFYVYRRGNSVADSLLPGYGYWVQSASAGKLLLSGAGAPPAKSSADAGSSDGSGAIVFSTPDGDEQTLTVRAGSWRPGEESRFVLPPVPPAGAFDVRFVSAAAGQQGMIAACLDPDRPGAAEIPIEVRSASWPVSIRWRPPGGPAGACAIVSGGRVVPLEAGGEMTLEREGNGGTARSITLVVAPPPFAPGSPESFALFANYPNPFNPLTLIPFRIAEAAHVRITVCNILGQEVATLLDADLPAGGHAAVFRPVDSPTGVYTARMRADTREGRSFTGRVRMLYVK